MNLLRVEITMQMMCRYFTPCRPCFYHPHKMSQIKDVVLHSAWSLSHGSFYSLGTNSISAICHKPRKCALFRTSALMCLIFDHCTAGEDPPLLLLEGFLLIQCIWMFGIATSMPFCSKLVVCIAKLWLEIFVAAGMLSERVQWNPADAAHVSAVPLIQQVSTQLGVGSHLSKTSNPSRVRCGWNTT